MSARDIQDQKTKAREMFVQQGAHADANVSAGWRLAPRIAIRVKRKVLFLDVAEIVAVQAEGNYISLRHRTNPYLLRESLSSIAEKLRPYGFIRIHRSVIVNISTVEEIQPLPTGEYRLRIKGGKEYLVTRTYKQNLRDLAELWVGTERPCGYHSELAAKLVPDPQRTNGDHRRKRDRRPSAAKVDSHLAPVSKKQSELSETM